MLYYPKIPGSRHCPLERGIAFEKYDGTNLHWSWDRDFGWHTFGTRRDAFVLAPAGIDLFCQAHSQLHARVDVFRVTLADGLEKLFREHERYRRYTSFRVFTEFFGPGSFAGLHRDNDPKQLILFDVEVSDFGLIGPRQLVDDFGHLRLARVVYEGKITGKFADDVRLGKYGVSEGVVCKGGRGGADLWMVKIKTSAYLERLKAAFAERWEDYWE
jgi:hypothetical protein